jgi:hypothetical protein
MRRLVLALAPAGCMGPLVSDMPGLSGQLLPAGANVPFADDDPALSARLHAHEQVSGLVAAHYGFRNGAPASWWDFGTVPVHTAPMFVLVDATGQPIAHPEIVDFAPGDPGYSPLWTVWNVEVTDRYAGELITSVTALDEALRAGLVTAPIATYQGEHGPIITRDIQLDIPGAAPFTPDDVLYYRGTQVAYFDFDVVTLASDHVTVATGHRYVLRRDGDEPLNEVIRSVDMDGDGDIVDSNDILSADDTPVFATVDVVVPSTVASIDTTHDQTMADLRTESQLFAPAPVAPTVISYTATGELRDLPATVTP